MQEIELTVERDGVSLPATLTLPGPGPICGGIVPLHPSSDPERGQFLFRQLAEVLPPLGVAVLRYDRRPNPDGRDVPLEAQAGDALAATRMLRGRIGSDAAPIGLWGFSQGAWAAPLAAAMSDEVAFLALVASTGVSPARQMRYGTEQQVLRAGYGGEALVDLATLRGAYEAYLRGDAEREPTQALVDRMAGRAWFPQAYVPDDLPPVGAWRDMDFDPAPIFARVRCPVLLFYGEDDEWTPADESIEAWRRAAAVAARNDDLTVVRLPGAGHHPTLNGGRDEASISPLYTQTLLAWIARQVGTNRRNGGTG
jgi:pimeloyl-ACP methyl ester carboxylesterase